MTLDVITGLSPLVVPIAVAVIGMIGVLRSEQTKAARLKIDRDDAVDAAQNQLMARLQTMAERAQRREDECRERLRQARSAEDTSALELAQLRRRVALCDQAGCSIRPVRDTGGAPPTPTTP